MGTGTLIASADFLLGSKTVTVINRYSLAPNSKFLEVTTSVENPGASAVENVNVWVGTRDDWVGIKNDGGDNAQTDFVFRYRADLPQKFRGTITDGVFQTLSSGTTERASALVLESIDGAGLFFSTSLNVNAIIAPCCETLQIFAAANSIATGTNTYSGFENAVTLNPSASAISTPLGAEAFKPANPDADFHKNRRTDLRDAGYAIHLPLGSIASGQSKGATWFLGGTAYSERSSLLQTVSEAAEELSQAAGSGSSSGSESSSSSGISTPVIVPETVVTPGTTRQPTVRKASGDGPARLLGRSLNKDVLFSANSTTLSSAAKKSLRQAARLAKAADGKVAVTGFAAMSNRGSAYERSVALKRARVVARFLRARGFDDWIYFHGLSGRQGQAFEGNPRRVEIRILN
jgi:outer membrane protein OmpA-like peptidoglycan-associated protein